MSNKKFKCTVCGYVHEGDSAPSTCPVCAAPASAFVEQTPEGGKKSKLDKNSNLYIMMYASVMVILVAAVLTFASLSLAGRQAENVRIEKMGDILRSIGEGADADTVADKAAYITEEYNKYIVESYAVNVAGDRIDDVDAFKLLTNLKAEYDKAPADRLLPVFVSKNAEGTISYIIPVWGKGLWGPIWGYVALADNWDTINGVVFDHKSETPGLGAEIATANFQAQFKGKQILKDGKVVAIVLQKGGAADDDPYAVDALSGGTLTSHGLQNMLKDCLSDYDAYIRKQISATDDASSQIATTVPAADVAVTDSLTNNQ